MCETQKFSLWTCSISSNCFECTHRVINWTSIFILNYAHTSSCGSILCCFVQYAQCNWLSAWFAVWACTIYYIDLNMIPYEVTCGYTQLSWTSAYWNVSSECAFSFLLSLRYSRVGMPWVRHDTLTMSTCYSGMPLHVMSSRMPCGILRQSLDGSSHFTLT